MSEKNIFDYIYHAEKKRYYRRKEKLPTPEMWDSANTEVTNIANDLEEQPSENGQSSFSQRINNALTFLDKTITIERMKEIAFLQMLSKSINKDFSEEAAEKLNSLSGQANWKEFMLTLHSLLGEDINKAREILNQSQQLTQTINQNEKDLVDTKELTSQQLQKLALNINTKDLIDKIVDTIIQKFSNPENLSEETLTSYVQSIVFKALIAWIDDSGSIDGVIDNFSKKIKPAKKLRILESMADLNDQLNSLTESLKKLERKASLKELTGKEQQRKTQLETQIKKLQEIQSIIAELPTSLKDNVKTAVAQAVALIQARLIAKEHTDTAEIVGLARHAVYSTFVDGFQAGQSGAKQDIMVGHMLIKNIGGVTSSIRSVLKTALTKILNDYEQNIQQTNTFQYYKDRATQIRNIINDSNLTKNAYSKYIENWFVIEESTKAYIQVQQRESHSFEGGSVGPDLKDQLEKITTIITSLDKGIVLTNSNSNNYATEFQKEMGNMGWFLANTLETLIAHKYQEKLLIYLSAFLTIFLFDDQVLIWEQTLSQLCEDLSMRTDDHRLHLFALNGKYYPLSLILQATYNKIQTTFNSKINPNQLSNSAASALLVKTKTTKAFTLKSSNLYRAGTPNAILEGMKLEVDFLTDFHNLLEELYSYP